ncbi:MAG TPA: TRAP transporter TatT component family protein [Verrucomicrobiae bacterium]|nr:TRAP transporter TatT component family protein [Verrucomicrobiae bacterium]
MHAIPKYPAPGIKFRWLLAFILAVLAATTDAAEGVNFTAEAEAAYRAALAAYDTNKHSTAAAVELATRAFDYADLAPNDTIRENTANAGMAIAREVIAKDTNSVGGHYYLALNIGQLARTKMLGALKLLDDMERELKIVIRLDPKFDYAGGDRTIGVLYAEAPGFSVGDNAKAKVHLAKAVQIAPEFPDNHLCYMEALAKWRDWKTLTEKLGEYRAIVPAAKAKFTGPEWGYEWHDWTRREKVIAGKLQKR